MCSQFALHHKFRINSGRTKFKQGKTDGILHRRESHAERSGKTRHESQLPLSSRTEQHHRKGRPVVNAFSSSCSEWNVDKTWSSQEWKSDELIEDRTGRPVVFAQHTDRFLVDDDKMNSYTVADIRNVVKNPDHS